MKEYAWTKYPYDPKYPELLVNHMAKGMSFNSFGGVIRVPYEAVRHWLEIHPEFKEAHNVGMQAALATFEQTATDKSNGRLSEDDAKLVDSNLLRFMMTSRFRDIYAERREVHAKVETLKDLIMGSLDAEEKLSDNDNNEQ